jgi:hypothetical protein
MSNYQKSGGREVSSFRYRLPNVRESLYQCGG